MKLAVALFLSLGLVACATSSSGSGTGEPAQEDLVQEDKPASQDHEPPDKADPTETTGRAVAHAAKQAAADAAKIECARVKAMPGTPEHLSLEELATEGGFAEVFEIDDEVVRLRGGLLFETSRLRFDYVYANGRLRCAEETVSNVHVMSEGAPGWAYYWHHQHLVFDRDTVLSVNRDHTAGAGGRGRDQDEIREFAEAVLAVAKRPDETTSQPSFAPTAQPAPNIKRP